MITSFGRYFKSQPIELTFPSWNDEVFHFDKSDNFLPVGNLKSYGDSCLLDKGRILQLSKLNKIISFNPDLGLLKVEAGITLEEILQFLVPRGYYLYVTPGTKLITVGGAIANDIHGKNHHYYGSFGNYIQSFDLLRSNGDIVKCSESENTDYYKATIGGFGLTGIILNAEILCKKIETSYLDIENIKFKNLNEFFSINQDSLLSFEATVAWVDIKNNFRGIYNRGNFAKRKKYGLIPHSSKKSNFPINYPIINNFTISIFNQLFYFKQFRKIEKLVSHYESFYYPLDKLLNWNKVYGNKGFFQYQFVIPLDAKNELKEIANVFKKRKQNSFLNVLKTFGDIPSKGLMSFPQKGITLAVDFAFNNNLHKCLEEADKIVIQCGGRLYPAKDSRMNANDFKLMYQNLDEFKKYIDPKINSDFAKRMLINEQ